MFQKLTELAHYAIKAANSDLLNTPALQFIMSGPSSEP